MEILLLVSILILLFIGFICIEKKIDELNNKINELKSQDKPNCLKRQDIVKSSDIVTSYTRTSTLNK